ncbi:MAG: hypothetical protein COW32_06490 [Candidatus Aquicultor secundus]|uniref:Uncharacterized protein n=1 Tax=Candidatus Aquicultor secundus TaxID=1973895 RepID=A0A2M7T4W8_9ACTN|nr:hypothetical protein [Candidatus Aquicultor secundus]OIO85413.1 MAG: hypothetical protein AUK32_07230 [Candidatus Aquicultor secundus]PIU26316.1 MAG: hypothetical protein COT10_09310 [Candidatus Aquicultor secundus]PIW22073.1 MAG: hypothetical protein COW32_06490 [Candidatus Aquicultor secundus]PIX51517.1 MAG: hypothetical protein COZ51_09110 [Candidatus Aquicultor secundus]PIY40032.1 MAG: hypothetical protein COZ03_04845 [Candidatus Aquicultor secundus]
MVANQLDLHSLTPNDSVIAIFCVAIALLAVMGVRHFKDNHYFKYFAVSFSFFFISTAASILKSLDPGPLGLVENITLIFSALPVVLAALRFRRAEP